MIRLSLAVFAAVITTACAVPQPTGNPRQNTLRGLALSELELMVKATELELKSKPESKVIEEAQEAVRYGLKDPASAQFREVRLVSYRGDGRVVCGQVNAKNSYGGYVGFKRFIASSKTATIEHTDNRYPQIAADSNAGITAACSLSY